MAAVREFALPDLGEGLPSAEVVCWLVDIGDVITVDQPVAEVETAKAVVAVPCPYAGVVTSLAGPAGTAVPVGAPLVTVAVSEPAPADGPAPADEPAPADGPAPGKEPARAGEPTRAGSGNILVGYGTRAEPTRARRRRVTAPHAASAPTSPTPPASPTSDAPAAPVEAVGAPASPGVGARTAVAVVSPLVRRLARDHAVDLRRLTGSGPDGLIRRRDVETAIALRRASSPPPPAPAEPAAPEPPVREERVVPLGSLGRRAAETFARSRREVPDASCWVDADATALLAARDALNAGGGEPRIGLLAILARACVAALVRFPELNSTVVTDAAGRASGVRRHGDVRLGFAAQTPRGLVVPVVHGAERLSTSRLAAEIARLTTAARAGTLTPAELTGGTFTLNNYGVFGVDGATPIINHPEVAMIGVGRIIDRPWAVRGELAVRAVAQLSFTFDHRVCDGATAGAFLRFVADAVENPLVLLRDL